MVAATHHAHVTLTDVPKTANATIVAQTWAPAAVAATTEATMAEMTAAPTQVTAQHNSSKASGIQQQPSVAQKSHQKLTSNLTLA